MTIKYDIILLDPPWSYLDNSGNHTSGAADNYELMTNEDIYALPVNDTLATGGVVFVWATSPKLHVALEAIEAWGLNYRGIAHTWIKTTKDGRLLNGTGVRATYSKPQTELLLFSTRFRKGRVLPKMFAWEGLPQQVMAAREGHSVKPAIFQELIERQYPSASKLELFARRHREGWTCRGLELTGEDFRAGL